MSAKYLLGMQAFAEGGIDWLNDDIKVVAVDGADYGGQITGATQANPVEITIPSHGFSTGHRVTIFDVGGMTELNGNEYTITVTGANTFTLDGVNGTGFGAYTSGGVAVNISADQYLADIPAGGRVGTSPNLSGKTSTLGRLGSSDPTITGITGDTVEAVVCYKDTGNEATSPLISIHTTGAGFPFTPNGGNLTISPSGGYWTELGGQA